MKKVVLFFFLIIPSINLFAQQVDLTAAMPATPAASAPAPDPPATSNVYLLATGGTSFTVNNIAAAGGAGLYVKSGRFSGILSYNWGGNVSKKRSSDSIPLSTLLFPDISSSAFLLKLNYRLGEHSKFWLTSNFAWQEINTSKDSIAGDSIKPIKITNNYSFNIINWGIGIRYVLPITTASTANSVKITATALYSGMWVLPANTNQSFDAYYFNTKTQASSLPKKIGGINAEVGCLINNSELYFRCFYPPFCPSGLIPGRFVFSVGIMTLIKTAL